MVVKAHPGTPCRVSLADAEVGDTVILVNYSHLAADSPYDASHAVFIREGAQQARPAPGEVPHVLTTRLISLRAFDERDMMIAADVQEGAQLPGALGAMFRDRQVRHIHLHYAKPGCFAASVTRT